MQPKCKVVFFCLMVFALLFFLTMTGGSEPGKTKDSERKIKLIQERIGREKLNYRGMEIPVFSGKGAPLIQEQQKMILTTIDDFKVNDDGGIAYQDLPGIATDDLGNFVITWQDLRNANYDIYAQRYSSSGIPQGSNFKANDDAGTATQDYPAVAMDGSGNFVITWEDYRNGNLDIYAQRYNFSGIPQGSNFKVNDDAVNAGQYYPAIGMDDSDNSVITWEDSRDGNFDIYAQRYNSAGTPQGSNFKVNDDTAAAGQYLPAIATDRSGNFVITWHDRRNVNSDIYAQRFNSSGTPQDSNFKVNDDAGTADQLTPAIATDGSGNFVVTWRDARSDNSDIYGQRYNSFGIPQGSNFKVNDDAGTADQLRPAIAKDSSDNFIITWEDYRNGNADIYAQRYKPSGNVLGANYLVTDPLYVVYDQTWPAIGLKGSNVYFTWEDNRNGYWDIYAKVVDWAWPHTCGDANGDSKVTVSDVVYLINYLFKGGPTPLCPPAPYLTCGDANGDGKVTVSDVVYLVNYLFKGGPLPIC